MHQQPKITRFNEHVLAKFQIYNSIFMTLPFDTVTKTGALLPLFHEMCKEGFAKKQTPTEIVTEFLHSYVKNATEEQTINLLFNFIQYIERQVVLFDAIEDAAFPIVNNMDGVGTIRNTKENATKDNQTQELIEILEKFKIRLVLTAHPTQFYPGNVLGIITDLTEAIKQNDLILINKLLAQLGKTPFFKKEKPTPLDEATSLLWYLENIFYHAISGVYDYIQTNIGKNHTFTNSIIDLGFWPGGDRDGNPYVTSETTLEVAKKLRQRIFKNYHSDIRKLKRKLTFKNIDKELLKIEELLFENSVNPEANSMYSLATFKKKLLQIKEELVANYQSIYIEELNSFINKVALFGYHFATLDIRQDSRVHHKAFTTIIKEIENKSDIFPSSYNNLSEEEKLTILANIQQEIPLETIKDSLANETLATIHAIKKIQEKNGEKAANRYIISNNQSALNVMEVFAMLKLCGFQKTTIDIVPLFETIDDLKNAPEVLEKLFTTTNYMKHLKGRNYKQVIMLGFSDGTKDGGYLKANWSIYKAKEEITSLARKYHIEVIFFDGRGGPPARGGGKTHQFYASQGPTIENKEIQLTIQGQTISSNFGTIESAQYNMEQLLSAGISNTLFKNEQTIFNEEQKIVMEDLANTSYAAYAEFKNHPKFLAYLEKMSTLKYYAKANIGSRPSKRNQSKEFNFSDLRAIPFVGSWSQLKQNVPGFFGVGTALKKYDDAGEFEKVVDLYNNAAFFKTLIGNSMMALTKSFFELTRYMENDEEFGEFWKLIYHEFETTKNLILKLSNYHTLMQNNTVGKASIEIREDIVLPLLTIQQYALIKIQELQKAPVENKKQIEIYEKMVTRSLFGNINASRNSA